MRSIVKGGTLAAAALLAVSALVRSEAQQPQSESQASSSVVGDAQRGAPLFSDKYNCYACHGFDAQSGERRLVPMNYTQDGFITFVQKSPLPQMPAFPDASAQDLADIYAYIKSIPMDAPPVDELPALRAIRARQREALTN
jgi:mono/diheme cytochrome c family protein